jgi:hypothetical protein
MEGKLGLAAFPKLKTQWNLRRSVDCPGRSRLGLGMGPRLLGDRVFISAGSRKEVDLRGFDLRGFDLRGFDLNLSLVRQTNADFYQSFQPPDSLASIAGDTGRIPHIDAPFEEPIGKLFQVGQS